MKVIKYIKDLFKRSENYAEEKVCYVTLYYYRVTLNVPETNPMSNIVYYRGEVRMIAHKQFEWSEQEPITYKEALSIVQGTENMNTITGTFKL